MFHYIRRYPLSLLIIVAVIYLSFFKPPTDEIPTFPYMDKMAHVCMYFGISGMLWVEFLRTHRRKAAPLWHAWVGALLCPIIFGGTLEVLQAHLTTYRGGDWWDFAANTAGALLASLLGYFVLRPLTDKR